MTDDGILRRDIGSRDTRTGAFSGGLVTNGLFKPCDIPRLVVVVAHPPVATMQWFVLVCTLLILVASAGVATATASNVTTTNGSLANNSTDGPSPDQFDCPSTCFCDLDSSLVSCAGVEEDTIDVTWLDRDNQSVATNSSGSNATLLRVPADVWSLVAANGVQRLDIRDLMVEQLNKRLLNGTERLNELSLVRCSLVDIGRDTFSDHDNLERLDLSQNQLTTLSKDMLTGLIRLRSLDLSSNKLTLIDGALETLITLEQLNLRGNALTVLVADTFKGVSRLQFLNVDGNRISAIAESAFQGMGQLAHLILSRNPLSGIQHVDLFAARPAYVDLSSAQLRSVPSLIARYVRDLRLSGNNFSRLHRGDFESVPQVRALLLDDSQIGEIEEDALGRMDLLEQLSLNGNRLTCIPASLPSTSLSALHLEGNQITALRAGDFDGLRRLDQLHLAHNVIVSIATGTFDQLTSLTRLDLRANRLSYVSRDLFGSLVRLRFLDLSDNPLIIPRADAERLRHLTAVVKVIITTIPNEKANDGSIVAKVTELLDGGAVERSEQIVDSSRRFSHNGANEPSTSTEMQPESATPQQALVLVGALLSLSVLIALLFIITDRLMKPSRWNASKTTALWRRRGVASVEDASATTNTITTANAANHHLSQKDVIKLGWIPVEDFDHWSNALLQSTDTEHERLLLAVSPHQ